MLGPSGILWFAFRFNREDSKAAVGTMREVAAELRLELDRTQKERDALRIEVSALREECGSLRLEVSKLRESVDRANGLS